MITQILVNAAITGSTYALIACAFNIAFRVLGFYYITLGALIAAASLFAHWTAVQLSFSWFAALPATLAFTEGLALLDHFSLYVFLKKRGASPLILFLGSTAAYFVLSNSLLLIFGPESRAFPGIATGVFDIGTARLPQTGLYLIVAGLAIWGLLLVIINRTRLGLAMRAIAENENLATIMGISATRTRLFAVSLVASIAAISGILIGLNQSVRFSMGMPLLLKGILAAVLAGLGNIPLAAAAGLCVGITENIVAAVLPSGLKDVFVFLTLAILLVWRPQGLLSRPTRLA